MTGIAPLPRLMVAPNGARRTKDDHPALPITEDEIVAVAVACADAGADGIHIHVRDDAGRHSIDPERYRRVLARIEEAAPSLYRQVTSEAAGRYGAAAQREMIRTLRPAHVSAALRELMRDPADVADAATLYQWAINGGVNIHHIVYSADELAWFLRCVDDGVIPGAHHALQIVLGDYAGTKTSEPAALEPFLDLLENRNGGETFDTMVCAFGKEETECLAYAASRGCKVRVGFENSLFNASGTRAADNAERVAEVLQRVAQASGGQPTG